MHNNKNTLEKLGKEVEDQPERHELNRRGICIIHEDGVA